MAKSNRLDSFNVGNTFAVVDLMASLKNDTEIFDTPIVIKIGNRNHSLNKAFFKNGKLILIGKR